MKKGVINTKMRRMIAQAKINHLKYVINRNRNKVFFGTLLEGDWELEAEMEYWQNYIDGLDKTK